MSEPASTTEVDELVVEYERNAKRFRQSAEATTTSHNPEIRHARGIQQAEARKMDIIVRALRHLRDANGQGTP